jgi:rubredoxin
MTLIIHTTIRCDVCGVVYGENTSLLIGGKQRNLASQDSWLYSGNKDYCPACRPKTKEGFNRKSIKRKNG